MPESDYKDLSKINTNIPQRRNAAVAGSRPIYGLDTETYRGNIFLLADSDHCYVDKDINVDTVIDFLFQKKYQNAVNVFFNIKYDAAVILKLLGNELYMYLKTRRLVFQHKDYRIKYIPNKCLTISKGHHSISFYDIAQFYGTSLVDAYEKNIGPLPLWYMDLKGLRSEFSPRFYRRNTTKVRNYCFMDCEMTKRLGEKWLELYHRAAGFYPLRLLSSGYLVEKAMVYRGLAFPKFGSIPYAIQELAYRAYSGGRFEMFKRGFIGRAYLYDVNSAYPDKIGNLPDLTDGEWVSSTTIDPDAALGFFKIVTNVPDTKYVSPFPFRANHNLVFPAGKFVTYATIEELRACNSDWYEILKSWQFIPNDHNYHPYKDFIDEYYAKKTELKEKGDPLHMPFKTMLNSIYGKTGETILKGRSRIIGHFFMPVIFAHITGATRAQLYRYVMQNGLEKDVVFMATDSVCTTRNLGMGSPKLGDFALKQSADDLFCIQNGINRWNRKWKERGIGMRNGKSVENFEIAECDGRLYMMLKVDRVTNLKSAIIQNKISEIGAFREDKRKIDLNGDSKRLWLGKLASLQHDQYNDSISLSLTHLNKHQI
ncbi:DNA polymerase [Candidatus Nitrososphaera sp. FF02]|uniref:DNA polymerase n=1 Tax=Candidatus Nitrososphaera sp. FF02 TaxID=3398226 RepID=UPI0039EAB10E